MKTDRITDHILPAAKRAVYGAIRPDDINGVAGNIVDGALIVLIIVNTVLVIIETFNGLPARIYNTARYIETASVAVFTVEYALRLWTADFIYPEKSGLRARLRYALSFMAVVDLLAILPFYLPFAIHVDLRVLRLLRLLRMLRIFKVNRYTDALTAVSSVLKRKASQLISSMLVVIVMMVIASVLMYYIEYDAQPDVFRNALSGVWWAVATLTTVGYGDIYPITPLGKLLSITISLLGIGLVAVPTGIISAGFLEQMNSGGEKDAEEPRYCPHCGKKLK